MRAQQWPSLAERAKLREIHERADARLLTVTHPGEGQRQRYTGDTPTDGTEEIITWVALLDRAETAMSSGDLDDPYVQRNASRLLDSVYLYEHQRRCGLIVSSSGCVTTMSPCRRPLSGCTGSAAYVAAALSSACYTGPALMWCCGAFPHHELNSRQFS